jgi:hypothetical protein
MLCIRSIYLYAKCIKAMGKVGKGVTCSVQGCSNNAVRSLDSSKVKGSGLDIDSGKRAYLCEEHYKQWKKLSKQSKSDDLRLRYG